MVGSDGRWSIPVLALRLETCSLGDGEPCEYLRKFEQGPSPLSTKDPFRKDGVFCFSEFNGLNLRIRKNREVKIA